MKGILLAGGTGSRLYPLTKTLNKHMLPVSNKPMIYWPLQQFWHCNVNDILIVVGTEHIGQIVSQLGDGADFNMEFTYKVQVRPFGIADALSLARNFVKDEDMMVMLGDNIFTEPLAPFALEYETIEEEAAIVATIVDDPCRFGVICQTPEGIGIIEKPKEPISHFAQTGCYFYRPSVFDIIDTLSLSDRGQYEITDVNNKYGERGELKVFEYKGWWCDAGTMSSYKKVNEYLGDL